MTPFPRALSLAVAVSLVVAASAAPQSTNGKKPRTRQIFVTVTGNTGQPVLDLATSDFEISEGGATRTVLHAGLATNPMRVALMVDTSDAANAAIAHIRTGVVSFLETLAPEQEVMLVTTGRQMRVRVPFTTDRKKLVSTAGGLFGDGAGTPLMDALLEVDQRFMSKADDRWPVFVIVTSDGTESSTSVRDKEFNRWVDGLRYRAATVEAIALKARGNGGLPEVIAMNACTNTGGHYDSILASSALPDKLKALATQMNSDFDKMRLRYQIDFETETAGLLSNVEAGVNREGVKLQLSYQRRFP
ncbi:MAG TPA: VWA domain-containing protein [Vicinamibacterales bacterium]|jgi:hypothetical protein